MYILLIFSYEVNNLLLIIKTKFRYIKFKKIVSYDKIMTKEVIYCTIQIKSNIILIIFLKSQVLLALPII